MFKAEIYWSWIAAGIAAGSYIEETYGMSKYSIRSLTLDGDQRATLLRLPAGTESVGAILYIHGYSDYFFQDHVAEHFASMGFDFYALDLRRCGRSMREGDVPHYIDDVSEYFEELDQSALHIRADGHKQLIVIGHSTGGLTAPLWMHARRNHPELSQQFAGLVLINPWFELTGSWFSRTWITAVIKLIGWLSPMKQVGGQRSLYSRTLLSNHWGEWSYDLTFKPYKSFPVRAGWLRAIRRGQAQLHRGLSIAAPVLVLRSARSLLRPPYLPEEVMKADIVLNVADMQKYAPKLGRRVTVVAVENGIHDLFLSALPVREHTLAIVADWLRTALPVEPNR